MPWWLETRRSDLTMNGSPALAGSRSALAPGLQGNAVHTYLLVSSKAMQTVMCAFTEHPLQPAHVTRPEAITPGYP